jgi:hypothetical protein
MARERSCIPSLSSRWGIVAPVVAPRLHAAATAHHRTGSPATRLPASIATGQEEGCDILSDAKSGCNRR